jgi:hypothetical protein
MAGTTFICRRCARSLVHTDKVLSDAALATLSGHLHTAHGAPANQGIGQTLWYYQAKPDETRAVA